MRKDDHHTKQVRTRAPWPISGPHPDQHTWIHATIKSQKKWETYLVVEHHNCDENIDNVEVLKETNC